MWLLLKEFHSVSRSIKGGWLRELPFCSGFCPFPSRQWWTKWESTSSFCAVGIVSNKRKSSYGAYILEVRDKVEAGNVNLKTILYRWQGKIIKLSIKKMLGALELIKIGWEEEDLARALRASNEMKEYPEASELLEESF